MKKLSKEQKLEAYNYAIVMVNMCREYDGCCFNGVCRYLSNWMKVSVQADINYKDYQTIISDYFPEFYNCKPEESIIHGGYWWSIYDLDSRVRALNKSIKLLNI